MAGEKKNDGLIIGFILILAIVMLNESFSREGITGVCFYTDKQDKCGYMFEEKTISQDKEIIYAEVEILSQLLPRDAPVAPGGNQGYVNVNVLAYNFQTETYDTVYDETVYPAYSGGGQYVNRDLPPGSITGEICKVSPSNIRPSNCPINSAQTTKVDFGPTIERAEKLVWEDIDLAKYLSPDKKNLKFKISVNTKIGALGTVDVSARKIMTAPQPKSEPRNDIFCIVDCDNGDVNDTETTTTTTTTVPATTTTTVQASTTTTAPPQTTTTTTTTSDEEGASFTQNQSTDLPSTGITTTTSPPLTTTRETKESNIPALLIILGISAAGMVYLLRAPGRK